eukprot:g3406.t1
MGCVPSKAVVKRLEIENEELKAQIAQAPDKGAETGAQQARIEELEAELRVLTFKLEASTDLHSAATLDHERVQHLLAEEKKVTEALKHHIVSNTEKTQDLVWGEQAGDSAVESAA